jgi:hypothetical protein
MSHLTKAELAAVNESTLHKMTPYVIDDVCRSNFASARQTGSMKSGSDSYTYLDATDEPIRDDVLKWLEKRRKTTTADAKKNVAAKEQRGLFDGE